MMELPPEPLLAPEQATGADVELEALAFALISLVAAFVFQRSRYGLMRKASRDDEVAAKAAAVDKLGKKFGKDAVSLGSQRALSLQYLGAKIAFTRVPDQEEFKE